MLALNEQESFLPKPIFWSLLIAFIGLGAFLRFHNLDVPSIWIDELNHYYAAKTLNETGTATFPSGELNERALLYSKMVALSFRLFGENEFSLRLPSTLLGVGCIALAAFVAFRFFGATTALLTALFVAISPFAIGWSRLSRMYTLFQLLFVLGMYLFYLGYEKGNQGRMAAVQAKLLGALKLSPLQRLLKAWQVNLIWLALAGLIFLISNNVHELTGLFPIGLAAYAGVMMLAQARNEGAAKMLRGKYSFTFWLILAGILIGYFGIGAVREKIDYALQFIPKWAEGTRFEERTLYFNFLFDHYQFPMGVLFVIGAIQIVARRHQPGLYFLTMFVAQVLMFSLLFKFRHFQYLFSVYSLFTTIAAFAFANIFLAEAANFVRNWLGANRMRVAIINLVLFGLFLSWLPLTPSVRLARRIPLSGDGSFNGAMYMEEWREAARYVNERRKPSDLIITSDALGTLHYLGRVDYDLNFTDYDVSLEKGLVREDGEYFDLYSGAIYIKSLDHLQALMAEHPRIWLLFQHYKFEEAAVFTPVEMRNYIREHCELVHTTPNGTVLIFRYTAPSAGEVSQATAADGRQTGNGH